MGDRKATKSVNARSGTSQNLVNQCVQKSYPFDFLLRAHAQTVQVPKGLHAESNTVLLQKVHVYDLEN
jgi:hypothetical protein